MLKGVHPSLTERIISGQHWKVLGVRLLYSSTTETVLWWNVGELGVMGGLSSVVRALAAQASDLGSIPSDFPVFPQSIFSLAVCSINILLFILHAS